MDNNNIFNANSSPAVVKPWGEYIVLEQKENYWIKKIFVKKGARLSLQSHRGRSEVWVVLSGEVEAVQGDTRFVLNAGESITIEKNEKHRIAGLEDSWVLEAAFGELSEDDIIRYEDDYGRTQQTA